MSEEKPTLEQNKLELSLDSEAEETEPTNQIQLDKPGTEPIAFREAIKFQGDSFSCELYSSSLPVDKLAGVLNWIKNKMVKTKKQNGTSYTA